VIVLGILNAILAAVFTYTGTFKLSQSKEVLRESGMGWVDDMPAGAAKVIGIAEILGAVGLTAPLVTGIGRVLTPVASVALVLLLLGAVATHLRRHERATLPSVLAVFCILSAGQGFAVLRELTYLPKSRG
jgi:uncharacterized membrane protein YphA (DoxX/SURF4 family)